MGDLVYIRICDIKDYQSFIAMYLAIYQTYPFLKSTFKYPNKMHPRRANLFPLFLSILSGLTVSATTRTCVWHTCNVGRLGLLLLHRRDFVYDAV